MAATEKAAATATPADGAETKKRKFKVPHTFVIITVIILAVTIDVFRNKAEAKARKMAAQ